jgi:hypothetical protein
MLRAVLIAIVLLAVAAAMTASTAAVDTTAGPFEIWSLSQIDTL